MVQSGSGCGVYQLGTSTFPFSHARSSPACQIIIARRSRIQDTARPKMRTHTCCTARDTITYEYLYTRQGRPIRHVLSVALYCCTSASLSRAIPDQDHELPVLPLGGASPVGVGHPVCSTRTPVCAGPQVALPEAKTPGSRGDPVQRAFTKTWDKHAPAVALRRTASTIWALAAGSALQQCFNNGVFRIAHVHGKAGSGRGG